MNPKWFENKILEMAEVLKQKYEEFEKVKEILLEIADSHPHLMKNPTPNVIFKNFGDNSLDFQLIFTYNNGFRVNLIESDIRFLVYKRFKENNINIPFPQRVVHLEK